MNPSTELARDIVDGLVGAGVRHVVLAPGSRSAPLAYALLAAERARLLTLHVRIDERAAAFLALGLAKVSRVPAAVVTTSGTAVANLHPAVLEAHHGLVPLIVLSADRPGELRGIGANQTTTQPGMFGEAIRFEAELDADRDCPQRRAVIADAIAAASRPWRHGTKAAPGPVHLDVAFREPLVPDLTDPTFVPDPVGGLARRTSDAGDLHPGTAAGHTGFDGLPERTLVVIGDLPEADQARRVAQWAERHGWPVVAEPFGEQPLGSTAVPHGPLILATAWFAANRPDRVVVAGRVTLSRSVRAALTADPTSVTYLAAGPRWIGPSYDVGETLPIDSIDAAELTVPGSAQPSDWLRSWWHAAAATGAALEADLTWGSGPALARVLTDALPDGSTLVLGSSNSVRDVELAVDWAAAGDRESVRVVGNRGLAGIDGVVSTAVGIGLESGGPTYALVGDLTFLHDSNALLIGPDEARPDLTVVVANDDGGGIFSTLEPGEPERADDFERLFGTATGAGIEELAAAYRIRYARADSPDALADLVSRHPEGMTVIEVRLDRSGHRDLRARLRDLAEQATRTG